MNPRPLSTRLIYSPLPPCFNSRISFYVRGQLSKGSPSKIASIPEATSSGSRSVADLAVVGEKWKWKKYLHPPPPCQDGCQPTIFTPRGSTRIRQASVILGMAANISPVPPRNRNPSNPFKTARRHCSDLRLSLPYQKQSNDTIEISPSNRCSIPGNIIRPI